MNKINHQYNLGDEVYIHYNENCENGVVSAIMLTVERGDVHESYQVDCDNKGLLVVGVGHIGKDRDELIDKIVQVNSLSPLRKFINRYLLTVEYDTGGSINTLSRLHRQGYVIPNKGEIKLVQFNKVEYIKTEMGIEVKFHTDTEYYNEAYATLAEAVKRLRHIFDSRVKHGRVKNNLVKNSVKQ